MNRKTEEELKEAIRAPGRLTYELTRVSVIVTGCVPALFVVLLLVGLVTGSVTALLAVLVLVLAGLPAGDGGTEKTAGEAVTVAPKVGAGFKGFIRLPGGNGSTYVRVLKRARPA
jgi:hypothetical protein